MPSIRPVVVARNILLSSKGECLLGLRSDLLRWELPGGKVEDESAQDAAIREMLEETDIDLVGEPTYLGYADVISLKRARQRSLDLFFLWPSWTGFARVCEEKHLQWRWFSLDGLPPTSKLMPSTTYCLTQLLPEPVC